MIFLAHGPTLVMAPEFLVSSVFPAIFLAVSSDTCHTKGELSHQELVFNTQIHYQLKDFSELVLIRLTADGLVLTMSGQDTGCLYHNGE